MFFYLTNVVLDISSGALWWIIKNTTYGAYRGVKYLTYNAHQIEPNIENSDNNIILMKEIKLLRQEIAEIKQS
jgi:hypothetical protein